MKNTNLFQRAAVGCTEHVEVSPTAEALAIKRFRLKAKNYLSNAYLVPWKNIRFIGHNFSHLLVALLQNEKYEPIRSSRCWVLSPIAEVLAIKRFRLKAKNYLSNVYFSIMEKYPIYWPQFYTATILEWKRYLTLINTNN